MTKKLDTNRWRFSRCDILIGISVLLALFSGGVALVVGVLPHDRNPSRLGTCRDNLHSIGIALRKYAHDNDGRFPPAIVYNRSGRALYSWRVLILPYLDRPELYARFRLNESWDSPHNRQISMETISCYSCPSVTKSAVLVDGFPATAYVGIFHSAFEHICGSQNAVAVVEAEMLSVPWAAPDIATPKRLAKAFSTSGGSTMYTHEQGVNVLMCDGSVTLRAIDARFFAEPSGLD